MDADLYINSIDLVIKALALGIGAYWAMNIYREAKYRLQFDVDADVYKLSKPVNIAPFDIFARKPPGPADATPPKLHTHAVEILLKFDNKGKTRFRLYNAQVGINTLPLQPKLKFDEENGHLHLTRIFTSGHLVPEMKVPGRDVAETSFFYVEPGVTQTVHYLALVPEPTEFLQVFARFSMRQRRFPLDDMITKSGLYPHSVARTFQLGADGQIRRVD